MPELPECTLDTLASGAAGELFAAELAKVAEDILDHNSEPKATRTITLKVTIKPGDERSAAGVHVTCSSKLAPRRGAGTTIFLGRRVGGKPIVTQFDQKQMQLGFDQSTKPTLQPVESSNPTKAEQSPVDGKAAAAGE